MSQKSFNAQDLIGGLALIAIGLWFATQSLGMELGTSRRMGPGYFPLLLAGLLIFLGGLICAKPIFHLAHRSGASEPSSGAPLGPLPWRGPLFILAAPIVFGLTVKGLGFVPALFIACLLATQASRRMRPLASLVLALAVTAFSTAVFLYGLSLPFRQFGPWLRF